MASRTTTDGSRNAWIAVLLLLWCAPAALAQPRVSINNVIVAEGNAGTTDVVFEIRLNAAGTEPVVVSFVTDNQTAIGGSTCGGAADYVSTTGSVTFNPGVTTQTVVVKVCGETIVEPDERFELFLSGASGAIISDTRGLATITDDDTPPALSAKDVTVNEGNTGATDAAFPVTLSRPSAETVTVFFGTLGDFGPTVVGANGSSGCTAAIDFMMTNGQITFPPGTTSQTVTVRVCGDVLDEPDESFKLSFSNAVGATFASPTSVRGTIVDDDLPLPVLTISTPTVIEGGPAVFEVTLAGQATQSVTVQVQLTPETATGPGDCAASFLDFDDVPTIVTFAPGVTRQTLSVPTCQDTDPEGNHTFLATLTAPVGAVLGVQSFARATIVDNDTAPMTVRIDPATFTAPEGDFTASAAGASVSLTQTPTQTVQVQYVVDVQTASLGVCGDVGADFAAVGGTLTFPAGSSPTQTIQIQICGDHIDEPNETFVIRLVGAQGAALGTSTSVVTIQDDDLDQPPPLAITGAAAVEPDTGTREVVVNVALPSPATATASVQFSVGPESAAGGAACGAAGTDFVTSSGTLTFPVGTLTRPIPITICDDVEDEPEETILVVLSAPSGATLTAGADRARVKIFDNDAPPPPDLPALTIADGTVAEGSTQRLATLNVTLTKPAPAEIKFTPVVGTLVKGVLVEPAEGGSACGGRVDFRVPLAPVTIGAGSTTGRAVVVVCGDAVAEPTESVLVVVPPIDGVTLTDDRATLRITNDD